jgi:hypothetical protein
MTKAPKSLSKAVSDSRKKTGAVQTTLTLSAEEGELLEKLAKTYGGKKGALVAGLWALNRADNDRISVDDIVAQIRKRMK